MRKTDKKLDNAIRQALTQACDIALEQVDGFMWLTHVADYQKFPASLSVICIFNTNEQLTHADRTSLCAVIKNQLASIDIKIDDIKSHVKFDTEQRCTEENNGKWRERFEHQGRAKRML